MNLEELFMPVSDGELSLLANIDALVEAGVPRDMAERLCRWAFSALDQAIHDTMEQVNEVPDILERTLMRSLFLGGFLNWANQVTEVAVLATTFAIAEIQARGK